MKFYNTHQRQRRSLSHLVNGLVVVLILSCAAKDIIAQHPSAYNRPFTSNIYYGQQVCPPQQQMPWYPSAPGPQYAPAPSYVPQYPSQPRTYAPGTPMQQSPGRSLPNQGQSPQYQTQPSEQSQSQTPNAPNSTANSDTNQNAQANPTNPNAQAQVQNALDQNSNNGNSNNNIFQASLERELSGQGDDSFGGGGYGRGAQRPANSIGDFFGGRLRSRSSMLPVAFAGFYPDPIGGSDYFREIAVDDEVQNKLTNLIFLPNATNASLVNFVDTGNFIQGLPVRRTDGLVAAIDADTTSPSSGSPLNSVIIDSGPFIAETITFDEFQLLGLPFDPLTQTYVTTSTTEDLNQNGLLDIGEDINGNGLLDTLTEIFGIYREIVIPNPGDMVGRLKVAENNSPIPRDRVIFDYTYFNNAAVTATGANVQRFAPGFEKTLFGGNASIDVRLPFATTVESDISTSSTIGNSGLTNTGATEIGNLSVTGKLLVARDQYSSLSFGLQALLPTASDVVVSDIAGQGELLKIENKAIHLMPFVAWQVNPSDRFFVQYYAQYDHDSKGNPLFVQGAPAGTVRDVDFLYADVSAGYWMYRNTPRTRTTRHGNQIHTAVEGTTFLTGFAPRAELHYNRSLGGVEGAQLPGIQLGESVDKLESLNMTLGGTIQLGVDKEITLAWGTPLLNRDESDFDNEFRVMFNWTLPQ